MIIWELLRMKIKLYDQTNKLLVDVDAAKLVIEDNKEHPILLIKSIFVSDQYEIIHLVMNNDPEFEHELKKLGIGKSYIGKLIKIEH
jgi:hypothetical protein